MIKDNMNTNGRVWSLEYTTVAVITVLFAARKIFIAPSMSWLEVLSPVIAYYLAIIVLAFIKLVAETLTDKLSDKDRKE